MGASKQGLAQGDAIAFDATCLMFFLPTSTALMCGGFKGKGLR